MVCVCVTTVCAVQHGELAWPLWWVGGWVGACHGAMAT